jgi:hypothetical protein
MKTPEGKVKDAVKKHLDSIGAYYFMPVQTGYGETTVDFLVCHRGMFIAIETKAPGKLTPTARQARSMAKVRKAGGFAICVNDVEQLKPHVA